VKETEIKKILTGITEAINEADAKGEEFTKRDQGLAHYII
jgi:hypothetical protein